MQMASYVLVLTQARVFFPSALPARWVPDLTLQPSLEAVCLLRHSCVMRLLRMPHIARCVLLR